jgi:hypothetical protein
VENLELAVSNPPTQAEVQTLVEKYNEFLTTLKRA